jgi:hypothetical protein
MTPMRQTFSLITRLLSMEEPERHVLEIRVLLEELFARARDDAEQKAVKEFAGVTLAYLRGIEADTLQQTRNRRQEVDERSKTLLTTMLLHRGQTNRLRV